MNRTKRAALAIAIPLSALLAAGCDGAPKSASEPTMTESNPQIVSLTVYSGRDAPPAAEWRLRSGAPVALRVEGLGPPHIIVADPRGATIATIDVPLVTNGHVVGTELRFTPGASGVYQVLQADAGGVLLARLTVS